MALNYDYEIKFDHDERIIILVNDIETEIRLCKFSFFTRTKENNKGVLESEVVCQYVDVFGNRYWQDDLAKCFVRRLEGREPPRVKNMPYFKPIP